MEYNNLGNSGLYVSRLCFGVMTFGGQITSNEDARKMVDLSIDRGVNFFDTANIYNNGVSEEMLGKALAGKRHEQVIATKARFTNDVADHQAFGSSRKGLMLDVERSLKRLKTDYIDLYQLHGFDENTPLEETLRTLDALVRSGKVRYIGLSNFPAWQITKAQGIARNLGLERFCSSQNYYSLVGRDLEYEILPAAQDQGLGIMVWSPLAGGFLTGKYSKDGKGDGRRAVFPLPPIDSRYCFEIMDAVRDIADKHKCSPANIATSWLLHQKGISSVIFGVSNLAQLEENVKAVNIQLVREDLVKLDETSKPAYIYPQWVEMVNSERGVFKEKTYQGGINKLTSNQRNSLLA